MFNGVTPQNMLRSQRHLSRDERLSSGDRERRRGEGERRGDLDRLLSREVLRDLDRLLQNMGK